MNCRFLRSVNIWDFWCLNLSVILSPDSTISSSFTGLRNKFVSLSGMQLPVSFSKSKLLVLLFPLFTLETSPETVNNWKLLPTSVALTPLECSSLLLNNLLLKSYRMYAWMFFVCRSCISGCSQQSQSCSRSPMTLYLVLICFSSSGSGTLALDYSLHP